MPKGLRFINLKSLIMPRIHTKKMQYVCLDQWFSNGGNFAPTPLPKHLKMTEDISDYHNWVKGDTAGIEGLEARDAAFTSSKCTGLS